MPFAASNPHFYGRYPNSMTNKLEGIKPDENIHKSYIIVEPTLGVPIDQAARSQSNVIIQNLSRFGEQFNRFSNMALPTFWVEYVCINFKSKSEYRIIITLFFSFIIFSNKKN